MEIKFSSEIRCRVYFIDILILHIDFYKRKNKNEQKGFKNSLRILNNELKKLFGVNDYALFCVK
jgi:hypothetical protein